MARIIQSRDVVDLKLAAGGWVNVCRVNAEGLLLGQACRVEFRTSMTNWHQMRTLNYGYRANMKFRARLINQPKETIMATVDPQFRVQRTAPVVLMTLFEIHTFPVVLDSQSKLAALEHLLKEGLVQPETGVAATNLHERRYETTERGKAHIKMLCAMEPPVESAVWRHSVTLEVIEED